MSSVKAWMGEVSEALRPAILVGGGAYDAREQIEAFALQHSIPVFRTWNALDVITDDSPVYGGTVGTYGGPGRNFGIQNADALLVLGSRVSGRITGGMPATFARGARRFWVDLDEDLMREHEWKAHYTYGMGAAEFIEQCTRPEYSWRCPERPWLKRCREWVRRYDPVRPAMLAEWHHYGFMRRLSEALPANAIVTYDTGGNAIMMGHCFRSKRGQRIFSSNGNTPMGFSMCGAIGAWFAQPERPIICIIGDGGMQLNIQELQTIRHYEIPVKVFVINNKVLGNTKAWQVVNKRAQIACGPDGYSTPDFCEVAEGYRIPAFAYYYYFDVQPLLDMNGPVVLDVIDDDRCTYEPRISRFDIPIEDAFPYLPREEFRANMVIEPIEGWEKNT